MELLKEKDSVIYKYGDILCCYSPTNKKNFHFFKKEDLDLVIKNISKKTRNFQIKDDKKIYSVYIFITYNCNFNCEYCFNRNFYKKKKTLESKDIFRIINYLKSFEYPKQFRIFIYGGEPFLYKDIIFQLVREIKKDKKLSKAGITICTNGSFYSKQISKFLLKNKIYLSVSLDGNQLLNKSRVDKEGYETFTQVVKNIKKFKKDGVKITISCTINESNLEYLPQIPLFFKEKFGIKSFGFNFPIGKNSLNIDLLSYQLFKSYEVCKKLSIYEDFIMKRLRPFLKGEFFKECNAYGNQIVIYPDMSVSTCIADHINKVKTLDKKKFEKLLSFWRKNTTMNIDKCKECVFRYVCGKGCSFNSYIKKGDFSKIDEDHCRFISNFVEFFIKKPLNKKIKLVILDYDNTIVVKDVESALKSSAETLFPQNPEKIMKMFEAEIKGFFNPKKLITQIGKKMKCKRETIKKAIQNYFEIFDKGKLLEETKSLLHYLKRKYKRLVILSGNERSHLLNELRVHKILYLFDEVYCVSPEKKNSPNIYIKVLKAEGVQPYESLYIGDSFTEVNIAESLGMKTVLLKYGGINSTGWIKKIV